MFDRAIVTHGHWSHTTYGQDVVGVYPCYLRSGSLELISYEEFIEVLYVQEISSTIWSQKKKEFLSLEQKRVCVTSQFFTLPSDRKIGMLLYVCCRVLG